MTRRTFARLTAGVLYSALLLWGGCVARENVGEPVQQHDPVRLGHSAPRSAGWEKFSLDFRKAHPCLVCGRTDPHVLQTHHVTPWHIDKSLEFSPSNVVSLCGPNGCNAHFWLGHGGNFRGWNPDIREDAALLKKRWDESRRLAKDE